MLPVLLLLVTLHNLVAAQTIISVTNGGTWGIWGTMEVCDEGTEVRGFQLKVNQQQELLDDAALSGIALYCTKPSTSEVVRIIRSSVGEYGLWGPTFSCNSGHLKNFSLKFEPGVRGDNTAANNIKFTCSDGSVLEGNGLTSGDYGLWSTSCVKGMRGIQTSIQERQGFWTNIVNVKIMCLDK